MTVVDYGCGPGRYTTELSKLVGEEGTVYGADIHEMALDTVQKKIGSMGLKNVETVLVKGYSCPLPDGIADRVCALDMFFMIQDPTTFLGELKRITKPEGMLIIDDGHQKRATTKKKIMNSGHWKILEESKDHLKCKPV